MLAMLSLRTKTLKILPRNVRPLFLLCFAAVVGSGAAQETPLKPFEPVVGQAGKDVIWVPTPTALIEKMLDMAKVTPRDYVMDLGSGDGRNVIAAAKRGARALGVEYNQDMVELSRRVAVTEGVADRANFVQGDMYEADISRATVLALFLLPENLEKLTPKFLAMKPGTRIVLNGFAIPGWNADETGYADGDCQTWCTAYLYIVPANVAGTWRLPQGELALEQNHQVISGTLVSGSTRTAISNGQLRGDRISFTVAGEKYTGRVKGGAMSGKVKGSTPGEWSATRMAASLQ